MCSRGYPGDGDQRGGGQRQGGGDADDVHLIELAAGAPCRIESAAAHPGGRCSWLSIPAPSETKYSRVRARKQGCGKPNANSTIVPKLQKALNFRRRTSADGDDLLARSRESIPLGGKQDTTHPFRIGVAFDAPAPMRNLDDSSHDRVETARHFVRPLDRGLLVRACGDVPPGSAS